MIYRVRIVKINPHKERRIRKKREKNEEQTFQVPGYTFSYKPLAFILGKNSPHTAAVNAEILKLKNEGVVDRMIGKYLEGSNGGHDDASKRQCAKGRGRVFSLGFANVATPFALLAAGAAAAAAVTLVERVRKSFTIEREKKSSECATEREAVLRRLELSSWVLQSRGMGPEEKLQRLRNILT